MGLAGASASPHEDGFGGLHDGPAKGILGAAPKNAPPQNITPYISIT